MATIKELLGDAYKEGITFEEVEHALARKNLVDISTGNYVSIDKYNTAIGERDDFKTKYSEKLTEAEKEAEQAREREERYKKMERENSIFKYTDKLSKTITDKEVLVKVATLMADGKYDDAFEEQLSYLNTEKNALEERIREELMQNNPQANPQNNGCGEITQEQFAQMGVAERTKLYNENPQLYSQLNKT